MASTALQTSSLKRQSRLDSKWLGEPFERSGPTHWAILYCRFPSGSSLRSKRYNVPCNGDLPTAGFQGICSNQGGVNRTEPAGFPQTDPLLCSELSAQPSNFIQLEMEFFIRSFGELPLASSFEPLPSHRSVLNRRQQPLARTVAPHRAHRISKISKNSLGRDQANNFNAKMQRR